MEGCGGFQRPASIVSVQLNLKENFSDVKERVLKIFLQSLFVIEEKSTKRYRDFISRSFKEIYEICNISKAVQLPLQEQWARWLSYIQQDFSEQLGHYNSLKLFSKFSCQMRKCSTRCLL